VLSLDAVDAKTPLTIMKTTSSKPLLLLLASASLAFGIATGGCAAEPRTLSDPHKPSEMASAPRTTSASADMSVGDAQKLLISAGVESQPPPAGTAGSMDEALAILKSDELAQFPKALSYAKSAAKGKDSKKATALAAQIEIAWGENLRIVAKVVDLLASDLRNERHDLEDLEAVGKLTPDDKAHLETLKKLLDEKEPLANAMSRLAPVHLAEGRTLAESVVKDAPDSYEGYRVLADYYRIRGDWDRYDAMVKEVESRYPQSHGLLFLKGIALAERQNDNEGATKMLNEALKADPKFSRARVQLFFIAKGLTAKREEYQKLKAESPHHQLVEIAGPVLEEVFKMRERRRATVQRYDWRGTLRD